MGFENIEPLCGLWLALDRIARLGQLTTAFETMQCRPRSRASDNKLLTLDGSCRCPASWSPKPGLDSIGSPCLVCVASRASNDSRRLSNCSLDAGAGAGAGGAFGAFRSTAVGGDRHDTPRAVQLEQGNWRLQHSSHEITRVRSRGFARVRRPMV